MEIYDDMCYRNMDCGIFLCKGVMTMGVRINVDSRQDYSYLFQSLSSSGGMGNLNFLSDYASIKNGSYLKLMKAYYGSPSDAFKSAVKNNTSVRRPSSMPQTAEETKTLNEVQKSSDALKESADALLTTGAKSVFAKKDITVKDENGVETTEKGYDTAGIYNAVNKFVDSYNSVIQASDKAGNENIDRRTANMMNTTTANLKSLLSVGISVNKDGTLSLDKDTFMDADMSTVKTLFNGNGSYAYRVSAQASMINYAADHEAGKGYSYTASGNYGMNFNNGNLFNSW